MKTESQYPFQKSGSNWADKWIGLDCHSKEILNLSAIAADYCKRWYQNNTVQSLLVMIGKTGCGKTHTAKAIAKYCRAAAQRAYEDGGGKTWGGGQIPTVCFASWPETVDCFKEGNYGMLDFMTDSGLLVIDDLGAENDPSKNGMGKLCQILTRREHRFTVITTNILFELWGEAFDNRVADRLMRNSVRVDLSGAPPYSEIVAEKKMSASLLRPTNKPHFKR